MNTAGLPAGRGASRVPRAVAVGDVAVIAGQLGRAPHLMSRVVRRCPFGYPAAVENLPCDRRGRPFPTLFYCTCPTLVAAVGRLEDAGGVRVWNARLAAEAPLAASLATAARATRRRRRALVRRFGLAPMDGGVSLASGVGGVRDARRVTCLHAQAATALAWPGYALGALVLADAGDTWCADRRCAAFVPGESS